MSANGGSDGDDYGDANEDDDDDDDDDDGGGGGDDGDDDIENRYREEVQSGRSVDNNDGSRRHVDRRPHGRRPERSGLKVGDAAVAALISGGHRDSERCSGKLRRRRKKVIANV